MANDPREGLLRSLEIKLKGRNLTPDHIDFNEIIYGDHFTTMGVFVSPQREMCEGRVATVRLSNLTGCLSVIDEKTKKIIVKAKKVQDIRDSREFLPQLICDVYNDPKIGLDWN